MSKESMKERNKAIRKAWKREQELVSEGKGTRDWTQEQQQDILDPDKGKAYDENGYAFVGQHMKSAAKYPEYQGDPDNIQFLTNEEHLAAHKGNWHNPTNWYYNPDTKEYVVFGEDEIIPCKVIELSDPISLFTTKAETIVEESADSSPNKAEEDNHLSQSTIDDTPPLKADGQKDDTPPLNVDDQKRVAPKTASQAETIITKIPKRENGFVRGLKSVGSFIVNHPVESLEIASVVIGAAVKAVSTISSNRSRNNSAVSRNSTPSSVSPASPNIATQVADIIEKATRSENDVSAHRQRYHYKDGSIKWVDKSPYHRGGKNEQNGMSSGHLSGVFCLGRGMAKIHVIFKGADDT